MGDQLFYIRQSIFYAFSTEKLPVFSNNLECNCCPNTSPGFNNSRSELYHYDPIEHIK